MNLRTSGLFTKGEKTTISNKQRLTLQIFPSVEGLNNLQRMMKLRNPAVSDLKAESLIDAKLIQELDCRGYIGQLYSSYGVK